MLTRIRRAYRQGVERLGLPYLHRVEIDDTTRRVGVQGRDPRAETPEVCAWVGSQGVVLAWGKA